MTGFFFDGAVIGLLAAISPGPFQSLVIAQALLGGWRRAAPVTFGPLLSDIPIAITITFVLSQVPPAFLRFVRIAGAALLLYLAWGVWKEIRQRAGASEEAVVQPQSPLRGLLQGTTMIFLSPGPYLFWSGILGPSVLAALEFSVWHAIMYLVAFYSFSIGGLILLAYVIGRIGAFSARGRLALQYASICLMVGFAIYLGVNGLIPG